MQSSSKAVRASLGERQKVRLAKVQEDLEELGRSRVDREVLAALLGEVSQRIAGRRGASQ